MKDNLSSTPQAGLCCSCNIESGVLFIPLLGTKRQHEAHHVQLWRPRTSVTTMLAAHEQTTAVWCSDGARERLAGDEHAVKPQKNKQLLAAKATERHGSSAWERKSAGVWTAAARLQRGKVQ